jgi:hypothetical protein
VHNDGSVVLGGIFTKTANFGGDDMTYAHKEGEIVPYRDGFVARYSR